jgi:hypothetical protein
MLKPLLFLTSSLLVTAVSHAAPVEHVDVFTANTDGYHTYRIPAVLRVRDGTLLAFAEGRKSGRGQVAKGSGFKFFSDSTRPEFKSVRNDCRSP